MRLSKGQRAQWYVDRISLWQHWSSHASTSPHANVTRTPHWEPPSFLQSFLRRVFLLLINPDVIRHDICGTIWTEREGLLERLHAWTVTELTFGPPRNIWNWWAIAIFDQSFLWMLQRLLQSWLSWTSVVLAKFALPCGFFGKDTQSLCKVGIFWGGGV